MRLPKREAVARVAFAAAAAVALVGTSFAASAGSASAASASNVRRACAVTNQPNVASCMTLIRTDVKQRAESDLRGSQPVGDGYGPSQLQSAYKLTSASSSKGVGESVAVVDAYNDPNAVSDLAVYRSSWGLPACNTVTEAGCLSVVNQSGASSPLPSNSGSTGWATEESLDVDMVSAICPNCHIYLVEATSPTIANLGTGVNSAVSLGADFVSNSYGGAQSSSDPTFDTDYYQHPGIAVTVSAGDSGYGVAYPAASQYVTSVGGTSLVQDPSTTRGWTETVWGTDPNEGEGTGSGCSTYEAKPTWQTHPGCKHRIDNDIAAVADPDTGVAIYDTYDQSGWLEVGGTSVSSPIIASVFALAGVPAAGTYPSSYIYANHKAANVYDVTVGADGSCTPAFLCTAEKGYDGPTGWGTPHGLAAFKAPAGS